MNEVLVLFDLLLKDPDIVPKLRVTGLAAA